MDTPYAAVMGGWQEKLDAQILIRNAERLAGLSDWGGGRWNEERFRHDFTLLCESIEETGFVSVSGRSRSYARLMFMLLSRLRYLDARKHTRGIDEERIVAPLIGTGLPRAGTTFLHGVLAQDPGLRVARAFEAVIPVPIPGPQGDERSSIYADFLEFQGMADERLRAMHPFGADLPEECLFLQEGACTAMFGGLWNVPAFMAATADKTPEVYQWQIGIMQYLQSGQGGKRWSLKTPAHIMTWKEMQIAFPDALVYVNHRDPLKVIPSMAGLMAALRGLYSEQKLDMAQVAREQLAYCGDAMNRYASWRKGEGRTAAVVDVNFSDLTADPLAVVTRIYDTFGLTLTKAAKERMQRHLDTDHHGKGPQRPYSVEEFHITQAEIEATFGDYMDQFGLRGARSA